MANVKSVLNEKSKRTTVCSNNSSEQQKDHEKDAHNKELFDNTIALKNNFKLLNDHVTNNLKEFVDEMFKKTLELEKNDDDRLDKFEDLCCEWFECSDETRWDVEELDINMDKLIKIKDQKISCEAVEKLKNDSSQLCERLRKLQVDFVEQLKDY